MRVNVDLISRERERRAWSQEQLAQVAGLGVRTIQRIESSGNASIESVGALASVLEISTEHLVVQVPNKVNPPWRLKIALMASILLVGLTFMINRAALADQDFVLDVEAVVNEEHQTKAHVTNRAGENTEIQIWKDYRLFVLPTALDNGDVRLALQLQKYDGTEYVQVAGPRIVTPNGKPATVRSGWENGDSIVIEITPSIQDVNENL